MLKRIDHVGIVVDDLEAAGRLLSDVLGMRLTRTVEIPERQLHAAFYRCGETDVELIQLDDPEARASRLGDGPARVEHIAIEVDGTIEEAAPRLAEAGVRMVFDEPMRTRAAVSLWSDPESTHGVAFQFLQHLTP
jgi:methylmalonyl-CoA/ethylmalonyl-CoA epimerase